MSWKQSQYVFVSAAKIQNKMTGVDFAWSIVDVHARLRCGGHANRWPMLCDVRGPSGNGQGLATNLCMIPRPPQASGRSSLFKERVCVLISLKPSILRLLCIDRTHLSHLLCYTNHIRSYITYLKWNLAFPRVKTLILISSGLIRIEQLGASWARSLQARTFPHVKQQRFSYLLVSSSHHGSSSLECAT